ncbi:TetR family transcriptional regulator, partial [Streptomyces lasiicapitis]
DAEGAVELHDPEHPTSQYARDYKKAVAARLADTAREAGAAEPGQLGEQLALLIDNAIPATVGDDRLREEVSS